MPSDSNGNGRVTVGEVLSRRTDLSTFVVHLTRDRDDATAAENLESIVNDRRLRAGDPKGWATWAGFGLSEDALETQRVVCFSETPLQHVHSLSADIAGRSVELRPFGLALPKMVARWMGLNPVWYLDLSRAPGAWRDWPMKEALNQLVQATGDEFPDSEISRLTPFIEGMGSFPQPDGSYRHREFSWEREWRHVGDIDLDVWWEKIIWLSPEAEHDRFTALTGTRQRCVDPGWSLERMLGHILGFDAGEMTPLVAR